MKDPRKMKVVVESFFKDAFCAEKAELITGRFTTSYDSAIKITRKNKEVFFLAIVSPTRGPDYGHPDCQKQNVRHEMSG